MVWLCCFGRSFFDNSVAVRVALTDQLRRSYVPSVSDRSALREQDQCGQATKGVWGMSWRQEAKKGVEDCDKPGGLVKRELIPGCPNDHALNP